VLILGVGVAGLQAIATAKRLGAVIEASDVRPSVKDQVESLGGKWMDVPYANDEERKIAEGVGGYARPMPPEWMARQAGVVHERCKQMDIVITTALIPGRPAPKLVKADTVAAMKPGSVIGDLVVWSVTPALHTPLMSATNAISAIILVGEMLAAGPQLMDWGGWVGVVAVTLAAVNAFGGFLVTQRMLEMFRKKEPKAGAAE